MQVIDPKNIDSINKKTKRVLWAHRVVMCQTRPTVALLTQREDYQEGIGAISGIEDLDENSSASGSVGLSHNVLNMFFYSLFSNLEGFGDFFIGPPFCQMLND